MKKSKLNESGFHAVGLLLALLVLVVIGFIGLRVFHLHDNSTAEGKAPARQQQQPVPSTPYTIPAGWQMFTDSTIGAEFLYPNAFGAFSNQTDVLSSFPDYESLITSEAPKDTGVIGVRGRFSLITYKKGHDAITTRKYGPKVKLTDNGWVVVEPNMYNPKNYEPGDAYNEMTATNKNGLDVYTDKSADEGVMQYNMYFVSAGRLHQLQLPPFDNGAYSSNNIVDQGPYDTMFATVRDSVALY